MGHDSTKGNLKWTQYFRMGTVFSKNSILGVDLRYHLNQGLGLILNEDTLGNTTIESGVAFDNSDYLNTEQKTTYARSAISFDRKFQSLSSKVEIDYFYQIGEISDNTCLSRLELLNKFKWSFSKHLGLIAGFTRTIQNNNNPPSYFITLSCKDPLSWAI